MSLVTRCTSCGTLFKVVADQLKISEGWVRCGQCATVFDAQANLAKIPEQAPQSELASPSQAAGKFQEDAPSVANTAEAPANVQANDTQALNAEFPPRIEADIASDMQAFRDSKLEDHGMMGLYTGKSAQVAVQSATTFAAPPDTLNESSPSSSSPVSIPPDEALSEPELAPQIAGLAADQGQALAAPSFVVQAQRSQRWRSPWMRLGLAMVGLALLCALVLQIALHDKDRIAAQWPQAKPWLDQLCSGAGCKVQAFRSIEAISVDASSFNRVNKNNPQLEAITQSYRLAVTLKNIGTLPVALPHVELSLQDAQDQTVLRRVLSPADLGSKLNTLAPSQDMPGDVTLQIDAVQLAGSRIAGYRVLAFYP